MINQTILYDRLKKFGAKDPSIANKFKILKSGAKAKYNNMIVEYCGVRYHSLSEAYYHYLLKQESSIAEIQTQVRFKLENMDSKKTMAYIADFIVLMKDGREFVIDVKGRLTNENKVKLGYFVYVYKKPVILVETSGPDKFRLDYLRPTA